VAHGVARLGQEARPDHQVRLAGAQRGQNPFDLPGFVLAVSIHLHELVRAAGERVLVAGLQGRAVAQVERVPQHGRALGGRDRGRSVGGAIVHHDEFGFRLHGPHAGKDTRERFLFVEGRNQYDHGAADCHAMVM
jgi:hypothetical protein